MASVFTCPDSARCPGTDLPLSNFSSEAPDPPIDIGYSSGTAPTTSLTHHGAGGPTSGPNIRSSGPSDPPGPLVTPDQAGTGTNTPYPPLDSEWDNASVTVFAEVTDPDQNADDVAGNDNVDLLAGNSGTPGSGGLTMPNGTQQTIYVNHPQTCTIRCSDGSPFSYTVPTGTFRGYSQATVDRSAYNLACKRAAQFRVCLGNISSRACVGTAFNQTVTVDSASSPFVFEVTGGSLPSWATATVGDKTFNITGTPTSADVGTTIFTLFAQDLQGFSMTKDYTIIVMGVTSGTALPAFTQNVAYSSQVTVNGGTAPYTLTILSGNLPPGLTMDDEGLISGTPTVTPALYPVFIGITDSAGGACTETLAFDTAPIACPNTFGSIVAGSRAPLTNVGIRSGVSNLLFCGSDASNTVNVVDTTNNTIAGSFAVGAGTDIYGVIYVPAVGGASNPNDIIYALNTQGDLHTIDIDSFAVSTIDAPANPVHTFQKPVYSSGAKALFYATTQGTGINWPTATLWKYPIVSGGLFAAYIDVDGTNSAQLSVSHYTPTNNLLWFQSRDLGGADKLNAMNSTTLALVTQLTLSMPQRTSQGLFCSGNLHVYVPCYAGGNILTGPWNLDIFNESGANLSTMSLPSYCRGLVYDSTIGAIIALCNDRLRVYNLSDAFVCDIFYSTSFWGECCPGNSRDYIAVTGPLLGLIG